MEEKLALLEKEVKLGHQHLSQTKTLLRSKEALLRKKVRVTYNNCCKFCRGNVIAKHKSLVSEPVGAAKARLRLRRFNQFMTSLQWWTLSTIWCHHPLRRQLQGPGLRLLRQGDRRHVQGGQYLLHSRRHFFWVLLLPRWCLELQLG